MPTFGICALSPDSIGPPPMTSSCFFSLNCWGGIYLWRPKSLSINAMAVTPQWISACVGISWSFMVNEQVITTIFPFIDPSNTFTLLTERCEIPNHFKAFKTKLFPSTEEPSFINWPNLFPIPRNLSRFLLPLPLLPSPSTCEPSP